MSESIPHLPSDSRPSRFCTYGVPDRRPTRPNTGDPGNFIPVQHPSSSTEVVSQGPSEHRLIDQDMAACMELVRRRDEAALRTLYSAYRPRVFSCAMRILHREELAEEVVSASFLQAWNNASSFDSSRGAALAGILIIARSRAIDLRRRCKKIEQSEQAVDPENLGMLPELAIDHGVVELLDQERRRALLQHLLFNLSAVQRQVITLTALLGLTHRESAVHLGMPLGTVKTHARRGLNALKQRCLGSRSVF